MKARIPILDQSDNDSPIFSYLDPIRFGSDADLGDETGEFLNWNRATQFENSYFSETEDVMKNKRISFHPDIDSKSPKKVETLGVDKFKWTPLRSKSTLCNSDIESQSSRVSPKTFISQNPIWRAALRVAGDEPLHARLEKEDLGVSLFQMVQELEEEESRKSDGADWEFFVVEPPVALAYSPGSSRSPSPDAADTSRSDQRHLTCRRLLAHLTDLSSTLSHAPITSSSTRPAAMRPAATVRGRSQASPPRNEGPCGPVAEGSTNSQRRNRRCLTAPPGGPGPGGWEEEADNLRRAVDRARRELERELAQQSAAGGGEDMLDPAGELERAHSRAQLRLDQVTEALRLLSVPGRDTWIRRDPAWLLRALQAHLGEISASVDTLARAGRAALARPPPAPSLSGTPRSRGEVVEDRFERGLRELQRTRPWQVSEGPRLRSTPLDPRSPATPARWRL